MRKKTLTIIVILLVESLVVMKAYGVTYRIDYHPCMAYDPENNRYLVLYSSFWGTGPSHFVIAQFINADGTPSDLAVDISASDSSSPAITYDNIYRKFLLMWRENSGTSWDIVGQFVNADGTLNGSNFVISDANYNQDSPDVSFDTVNQRFLVAWADERNNDATGDDIYGQFVNANGTLNGSNFVISDGTDYEPGHLAIAYNSNDINFLVAFDGTTDCNGINVISCIGYALVDPSGLGSAPAGGGGGGSEGGCFITMAASRQGDASVP